MPRIAVIGTGTWGTAVAALAAGNGHPTLLWGRDQAKVAAMAAGRRHPELAKLALPASLQLGSDPAALGGCELVLWAVPTQHTRAMAARLAPHLAPGAGVVSLTKGLELESRKRPSTILAETLGQRPLAACSGPSHAVEVLAGRPACLVVAGDGELCRATVEVLHGGRMRLYTSGDLLGLELGGALKNVIAVGAGMCEGLGLGDNAKAALITRGLAEIRRLGRVLGAQDSTFAGMAGVGDLLTTCYSVHGRNRALGLAVARGEDPRAYLASQRMVAEGAWTCRAAVELGRQASIELPIAFQVASVLWDATPVATALDRLLARAPKEEDA